MKTTYYFFFFATANGNLMLIFWNHYCNDCFKNNIARIQLHNCFGNHKNKNIPRKFYIFDEMSPFKTL